MTQHSVMSGDADTEHVSPVKNDYEYIGLYWRDTVWTCINAYLSQAKLNLESKYGIYRIFTSWNT